MEIKYYQESRPIIEAVKVTREDLEEIAQWVGGDVAGRTGEGVYVPMGNRGSHIAKIGNVIAKDASPLRFKIWSESGWEDYIQREGLGEVSEGLKSTSEERTHSIVCAQCDRVMSDHEPTYNALDFVLNGSIGWYVEPGPSETILCPTHLKELLNRN